MPTGDSLRKAKPEPESFPFIRVKEGCWINRDAISRVHCDNQRIVIYTIDRAFYQSNDVDRLMGELGLAED